MENGIDVDKESMADARSQPSAALVAQEKAEKRAKKRTRDDQQASTLIESGRGKRAAGEKAKTNKVWMIDGKRKQVPAQIPSEKSDEPHSKKAKTHTEKLQTAKNTSRGKNKVPISQRSPTPPRAVVRKQTVQYKSKAKNSRKRKASDESGHDIESEDPTASDSPDSDDSELSDERSSSSGEEDSFNEDLSESGLAQQMGSELPVSPARARTVPSTRRPSDLFNDDDDVDIVSHQQAGDLPPLSDTEDPPSSIRPSSQENVRTKKQPAHHRESSNGKEKTKKPTKASEKRNVKFREERSNIVSASPRKSAKQVKQAASLHAAGNEEISANTSDDEDSDAVEAWPTHARLRGNGHRDGLRLQNPFIRATCRKAIKIVEKVLVTKHAWPELNKGFDYRVEVLKKAAGTLEKIAPEYRDIRKRVGKDEEFTIILGRWVIDRLSHARSPVRGSALGHIAVYQLGVGVECIQRVEALLACDAFVFPGKWEMTNAGKQKWVVDGSKIYLNISIINVIRSTFFATKTSLGHHFADEYKSTHQTLTERELTIPLVALAATGVYAALMAWKDGHYDKKKGDKFDGETFGEVYNRHAKVLEDLKKDYIKIFHYTMSELYKRVVGNDGQQIAAPQMNALAIMDLNGVPGAD